MSKYAKAVLNCITRDCRLCLSDRLFLFHNLLTTAIYCILTNTHDYDNLMNKCMYTIHRCNATTKLQIFLRLNILK